MAGYFCNRMDKLCLQVKSSESGKGLRECQIGAYWATKAHFTAHEGPALISLPTGAGKTALMMLLAFGLEAKRVLVITPTDVLRTQTAEKFQDLDGLVQAGVVEQECEKPKVHRLTARATSKKVWKTLEAYDVVVALPNNVSPEYNREGLEDIVPPPPDFFDVVLFDEAHHVRAPSWYLLLRGFDNSKCVLMTATPFRRDRRRIPARLVYYYPLRKAMDAGIYQPVKFVPIESAPEALRDQTLCKKATEVLASLKGEYPAKMLIRTDRIDKALDLEDMYKARGAKVEAVHSRFTPLQNRDTLEKLEDGQLDGIIAVGMLGEGLDIADLKVAVFHVPPMSFPFTIQLVGRITRPTESNGLEGCVIADAEQMRKTGVADEVRRLYREDQAWKDLIPELVEKYAGSVISDITPGSSEVLVGVDFADLAPYLSVRLYRVRKEQLNLDADITLGDEWAIYRLPQTDFDGFLGVISETLGRPTWARKTALEFEVFDLHLYYHHEPSQTLFVFTTSDAVDSEIMPQIIDGAIDRLGGEELVRLMYSKQDMDYMVAGLANALGPSGALPSYKMYLGSEVQGAIKPSDARVFTRGHVVARMGNGETRGISDSQGRVWSMKRTSIKDFISWCDRIGTALLANEDVEAAKGLEVFGSPKRQMCFPDRPLQIIMHPSTVVYSMRLEETKVGSQKPERLDLPFFEVRHFRDDDKKIVEATLFPNADADGLELAYDIEGNRWIYDGPLKYVVKVDYGPTYETFGICEFLTQYPPYFYLSNGSVIIRGSLHTIPHKYDKLPSECLVGGLDWTDCDVKVEYAIDTEKRKRFPEEGKMSIHEWVEKELIAKHPDDVIAFKDHGSGEIADYIELDVAQSTICLYHVKAAPKHSSGKNKGEANIGATIEHVKEALDQVLRSVNWVKSRRLIDQITKRHAGDNEADFIKGEEAFYSLKAEFAPSLWSYQVSIVNPGLDLHKVQGTDNVNLLLLTCYEWLRGIGCDLRIMGYDSGAAA